MISIEHASPENRPQHSISEKHQPLEKALPKGAEGVIVLCVLAHTIISFELYVSSLTQRRK
jgi:hypothetical protein